MKLGRKTGIIEVFEGLFSASNGKTSNLKFQKGLMKFLEEDDGLMQAIEIGMKIKTRSNNRNFSRVNVLLHVLNLNHQGIKVNVIGGRGSSSFGFGRLGRVLVRSFRTANGRLLRREWLVRECLGERRRRLRSNPNINLSGRTPNFIGRKWSFETRHFRMLGKKLLTASLNRFPIFREVRIE